MKKDLNTMKAYVRLLIPVFIFLWSCTPEPKGNDREQTKIVTTPVVTKPRVVPPDFSGDSAYAYVKYQADMGPRTPGSTAHAKAVAYYESQFKMYGAQVLIQTGNVKTFDGKSWLLKNVIASFQPEKTDRIFLCAHYDSRPFCEKETEADKKQKPCPGVNDGASGVGVLLEVARQMQLKNPDIGVDIILFDLEDYGDNGGMPDTWCLGSQYWSKNPHKTGYSARFGILLDMVGAKDARFPKEEISMFYANDVVKKVWKAARVSGASSYFVETEISEMIDDHAFSNKIAQIPTIDILHYEPYQNRFFEHHHKNSDDMSNIDKNTLKAVGQTLLEVIYNE
jgi:glutaminyl-peptide cyclotransferase